MRVAPLAVLLCLALAPVARAVPLHAVPDPRPGSAVVDLTSTLSSEDVRAIDAAAARGRSGGELLVVVVDSVEGLAPRDYTTQLFNRLGLDTRSRNRGVLLLAALSDRKAEIVVGDGFPGPVTRATDAIMSDVVVRRFRQGDPRAALVEGARALSEDVLLARVPGASTPASAHAPYTLFEAPPPSTGLLTRWREAAEENPLPVWGGLGGVGLVAFLSTRRYLRLRPRQCARCKQPMVRLDEHSDDAHLASSERTEESVGSVDYDIWMCAGCQDTLKLRYGAFFTSYSRCSSCQARTLRTTSTTLRAATEYSTGLAQVDENCAHCPHQRSYTRTIPRRPKPTSSSSSSGSGGGFSGGSSSGRGSSGSW